MKDKLTDAIVETVLECGEIMLEATQIESGIEVKEGKANIVTVYDKKVQEELKIRLKKILPEAHFVGEEDEVHEAIDKGYAFIVDPIDGTTNFMKGYQASAISVGLILNGEPYIGVVYNPYRKEVFCAKTGEGAYKNGERIYSSEHSLEEGIVLIGTAPYYRELADVSFEMARYFFDFAMDIRRSGSAAIDLCDVACGRAELFFEYKLCPWDYAAGGLIVTEAGGSVWTFGGEKPAYDNKSTYIACGEQVAKHIIFENNKPIYNQKAEEL